MQISFYNEAWHIFFFGYLKMEQTSNELVSCKKIEEFRLRLKKVNLNKLLLIKTIK